jgi:hypothetical protein
MNDLTAAAIHDPAVIAVAERVTAESREFPPASRSSPGGVRVVTRYGQTFETELMYLPDASE